MRRIVDAFFKLLRAGSLIALAVVITTALVRNAPGYLADAGEMDAGHASSSRAALHNLAAEDATTGKIVLRTVRNALHGNLGESRQFGVPVWQLLGPRLRATALLLAKGIGFGWSGTLLAACFLAWRRRAAGTFCAMGLSAALLAVPLGALATVCLALNHGGPVLILALTVGVRDFRLLYRLLLSVLDAPCIEHARALGLRPSAILAMHVRALLRHTLPQLLIASVIVALGAMVPLEVIFDLPGIGQLAWNAAMNRDIPVLQAVTALVAACVAVCGAMTGQELQNEVQACVP